MNFFAAQGKPRSEVAAHPARADDGNLHSAPTLLNRCIRLVSLPGCRPCYETTRRQGRVIYLEI
jgi:hypothetical protein